MSCETYLKYADNRFLKLVLYYLNEYIFKNELSTCLSVLSNEL
jgi:hypothetical protein